jgi:hypothetical protein
MPTIELSARHIKSEIRQLFVSAYFLREREQAPLGALPGSKAPPKSWNQAYCRPISHNCYWVFLVDKAEKHMISMVASKYADDHQADQVDQVNLSNDINNDDLDLESPNDSKGRGIRGAAENGGSGEEEIVVNPDRFDVLLGRGRTYRYHPGNLRFQSECFVTLRGCATNARNETSILRTSFESFVRAPSSVRFSFFSSAHSLDFARYFDTQVW